MSEKINPTQGGKGGDFLVFRYRAWEIGLGGLGHLNPHHPLTVQGGRGVSQGEGVSNPHVPSLVKQGIQ